MFDFVGVGIGWLLEHISTADMAIVGKGVLCSPKAEELNEKVLEQEVNMLFTATLNLNLNAGLSILITAERPSAMRCVSNIFIRKTRRRFIFIRALKNPS